MALIGYLDGDDVQLVEPGEPGRLPYRNLRNLARRLKRAPPAVSGQDQPTVASLVKHMRRGVGVHSTVHDAMWEYRAGGGEPMAAKVRRLPDSAGQPLVRGGRDWTSGCVALDDDAIDALWEVVPLGTPVTIRP